MEFQLAVKKYQQRVAELESTVDELQRELTSSRQAKSDAVDETPSGNESATAADQTSDGSNDGSSTRPHEQVNKRRY